ncbi:MAG: hypothetical protein M5U12_38340 [Verrucomicrobia bacterium]|nr:hypothetical protein [Verrucomicrobiota bacterium]
MGARPEDILRKDVPRRLPAPARPGMMPERARTFFQVGGFIGWILTAPER